MMISNMQFYQKPWYIMCHMHRSLQSCWCRAVLVTMKTPGTWNPGNYSTKSGRISYQKSVLALPMVWGGNIGIILTNLALPVFQWFHILPFIYLLIYLIVYWDKNSLCSIPGYPKMLSEIQARLRIIEIHLLELKACVSTSGCISFL